MNLRGYRGGIGSTEFRHMKFLKNKNIILKIIILLNCWNTQQQNPHKPSVVGVHR